jgi:ankyrin repeat protein
MNQQIVSELICPITCLLFTDPISVPCCTKFFERSALLEYLQQSITCPLCRSNIENFDAINAPKNLAIMSLVDTIRNNPVDLPNHRWQANLSMIHKINDMIGELQVSISDAKFTVSSSKCILVCDVSGSMSGNPINQVKTALLHIMSMCYGSNVKPIVVCFNSTAEILNIDMTMTIEEITKIIKAIYANGGTLFKSAFDKINQILEQNKDNQDINIIFLTDGEDGTKGLPEYFNDILARYNNFNITVHSVGFGRYCDKELLESLRSPVSGIFQYAEPEDTGDTLCNKITNLFEIACNLSKVPIKIKLPNNFSFMNDENIQEIQLPIQSHKFGEYKTYINLPENYKNNVEIKLVINSEYDNNNEVNIAIRNKSSEEDDNLSKKYISYLIDEISAEIINVHKNELNKNIKALRLSLIEQKLDSLITFANESDMERIKFLKSQLDNNELNLGKLLDSRFSSKFGFSNTPKNKIQSNVCENKKTINNIAYNESNINYNKHIQTRNELQIAIMGNYYNSITAAQQNVLNKIDINDIKYVDEDGNNALHLICYRGNLTILNAIINKFENCIREIINLCNNDNETPVTIAIKSRGYNKTLEKLITYGGIIPEDRKSQLEAYCIDNKFSMTAKIISNYVANSESNVISVNENQTTEYIKYTYDKILNKLENGEQIVYDPLNLLKVSLQKCIVDIVQDILKRHNNLEIPSHFLLEYCLPKKPDAEDTPAYIELAKSLLDYNIELIFTHNENNENCVFKAAEKGSLPHVKLFIDYVDHLENNDNSSKDLQSFKQRLDKKSFIDYPNNMNNTPLWVACSKRYPCIIEELLKNGANPNHINNKGNSPMYGICRTGPLKIAEMLLAYGADAENINNGEDTLILISCRHGQTEILKLLLNYTTEEFVNRIPSFDGFNALFAAVENNNPSCIIALHEFGISLDQKTLSDNKILASAAPLHLAAFYNRVDAAKTLIELKCDPNQLDDEGRTPLIIAVIQGNIEIITLLRTYTDLSIVDKSQNTALSYSRSKPEISRILLSPMAKILSDISKGLFTKDEELQVSDIMMSKAAGIRGILQKSACVNVYDSTNTTPLLYAILYSNYNITKLYLDLGADPFLNNSFGLNCIDYAKWINNKRILALLKISETYNPKSFLNLKEVSNENITNRMLLYMNPTTKYQPSEISLDTTINYRFEYCIKYCILNSMLNIKDNNIKMKAIELEKENGIDSTVDEEKIKLLKKLLENIPFDIKFNIVSHIAAGEKILSVQDLIVLYVYTSYNVIDYTRYLADYNFTMLLMNAMNKIYPFKNEVFVGSDNLNRNMFKIGEIVAFPCILSASSMWRVALNNTPNFTTTKNGTILIIKSKTGKYVGQYSRDSFNGEVLFNPFTKFKVTHWYKGGDVIPLGQENVREYSYTIKDEDISRYLTSNKSLIIELSELE